MPKIVRNLPPVQRPGAGKGEHFPVNDPRSSRGARPPADVIDAVARILPVSPGEIEQAEIVRRLPRELDRKLDGSTYSSYTSKALGHLLDEGRAVKVSSNPAIWQARA